MNSVGIFATNLPSSWAVIIIVAVLMFYEVVKKLRPTKHPAKAISDSPSDDPPDRPAKDRPSADVNEDPKERKIIYNTNLLPYRKRTAAQMEAEG